MAEEYVSRHEYDADKRTSGVEHERLKDENERQNQRIKVLEEKTGKILELATSVQVLAEDMKQMLDEQKEQGKRLSALENRDGEMWRKVVGYIATAIVGIVIGFLFKQFGM